MNDGLEFWLGFGRWGLCKFRENWKRMRIEEEGGVYGSFGRS